ncbi:MAG TPA: baseplate J/gp47 family protein [Candidatus Angelobacter sp.]|nr:baseplate J/gp47 family protein [Candidatus Angelobacter sp.]
MPLTMPNLDDRRYQELLDEALARVPVYTPEWTNFNKSDPGVTLIEVFAFMTESLLFRANQVPERNRKKFLKLLNVPLQPATSAQGLATITNDKGLLQTVTLNDGVELRAGKVPFRTTRPLDVLPIEGRIYFKQKIDSPSDQMTAYYQQLYASFRGTPQDPPPTLYQAQSFPLPGGDPVQLSQTVDGFLWLALFVRESDKPPASWMDAAREAIAGKTLTVGVVPFLENNTAVLPSGRAVSAPSPVTLEFDIPNLPASGGLLDSQNRVPQYRPLSSSPSTDVFTQPGVVDVTMPDKNSLRLWNNIDPLESGVGALPPSLEDTSLNDRLITWLRIRPSAVTPAQFKWIGINCAPVSQRERISAELLPAGTGEPDQIMKLSHAPVLAKSVNIAVTSRQGVTNTWTEVGDIFLAGPEVPVPDLRLPPGSPVPPFDESKARVFVLDPEAGQITFGNGAHGARPPEGSRLRATYDFSQGAAGNVGPDSMNQGPEGFKVTNPVRTWGGADAETAADGEKQISRYLQHRDRLVTAYDFETVTLRTPGVEIGRVEVLPNYHPELSSGRGGDAAGAVTLMLVPTFDPVTPDAPSPSNDFLDTVCSYLDTRRLVTTEVFLRGPEYVGIWISIGIQVLPGLNPAPVREAVKTAVLQFLAPIVGGPQQLPDDPAVLLNAPLSPSVYKGWPLGKPVISLEVMTVAGRTSGVEFVQEVLLTQTGAAVAQVEMTGLQLPRVLGISVTNGPALSLDELRGGATQIGPTAGVAQLPVIPGECN